MLGDFFSFPAYLISHNNYDYYAEDETFTITSSHKSPSHKAAIFDRKYLSIQKVLLILK